MTALFPALLKAFSAVLSTSWRACPALLVALAARLLLRRTPAGFWRVLWWGAFFRLACPFALMIPVLIENPRYQVPLVIQGAGTDLAAPQTPAPVPPGIGTAAVPAAAGSGLSGLSALSPGAVLTVVWAAGCFLLLLWGLCSLLRFSRCLVGAVRLRKNIWQGDRVPAPVTVGALRPRIYLPSSLEGREQEYVILHEESHIRWGDPLFKLLSFLLLAVHWFNPLAWAAFLLACRDMEAASDERVLSKLGAEVRQEYAAALLYFSTGRKILAGGPPAFGEGDAKGRIRRVMAYKKPALRVSAAAGIAVLAVTAVSIIGPMPYVYAVEKDPDFTPYDSFAFSLLPLKSENYRETILLTETSDFYCVANWSPTGLRAEAVLVPVGGGVNDRREALVKQGVGGSLREVFRDVPPGEYRFLIRSSGINQEVSSTSREEREITGAVAFGWQEGGGWQRAEGSSQRGTITFPAYREGREDYNAALYDIPPFRVAITLPEGWSVQVPPPAERRTSFAFTPLWLYQGEEYAGSIGYNTFELYPDVPPEGFYRMVYNQLMLGSVVSWDSDYTVVRDWGSGCSATVQIMERQGMGIADAPALRPGILSYDQDQLVYVAIDLQNGRLSSQEVQALAESIEILPGDTPAE